MIVHLVVVEIWGSDVDVEQIMATGELQRSWFRQGPGPRFQDVGDVFGAERLKGEPVGDGARHEVGRIDLRQGEDFADVMAGIEPALLQAVVIGRRIGREREKAQHQALFAGAPALRQQSLDMVGVFDVLVPTIVASVAGDELVVEVDANPVRISFDRQSTVSIADGDGIMIGVHCDAELARSNTGEGACDVIGMWVERPEMRSFLQQQIDGSLLCLAVDAHVGDGIEPDLCGGLDGSELGQLEPVEEILFDVANAGFDASLARATLQASMAKPWWRAKSK